MATYHSIFEINGKLGDYVFYELNGKPVVRRKVQKKRGAKSTAQKENEKKNTEFAMASKAGKYFREALGEDYTALNDRYLYQRINSLFLSIKNCDVAESGQRTVSGGLRTADGAKLLADFKFGKKKSVDRTPVISAVENGILVKNLSDKSPAKIVELQIDFSSGKFRRFEHLATENEVVLKKHFREKKRFCRLWAVGIGGVMRVLAG